MTRAPHGLLDTSTLIMLGRLPEEALPVTPLISVVTLAELSVGPLVASEFERAARQEHLQLAESDFQAIDFDSKCARAFGKVAADLRSSGRKSTARSLDAMIAATAIANGLPLFTCNPRDFVGISRLDLVAVPVPADVSPAADSDRQASTLSAAITPSSLA